MKRVASITIVLVLLVATIGVGQTQEEMRAKLQNLLLSAAEIGEGWQLKALGTVVPEPAGAVTLAALYEKENLTLLSALLLFSNEEGAKAFFTERKNVAGEKAAAIETLVGEKLADEALIILEGAERELIFRKGKLVSSFRTNSELNLVKLAMLQLKKIEEVK